MGTFHSDKGDLHGITVVVDTSGKQVFIGRCEEVTPVAVILNDAESHEEGSEGKSKDDFIRRAAQIGIWPKLARVAVPRGEVASIRRLGEIPLG